MNIYDQLRRDEGVKNAAYPDPLTKASPWTIGVGHTGSEVCEGLVWTDEEVEAALQEDVRHAIAKLDANVSWWRVLNEPRQAVLIGMCFNMGISGLLGFKNTLALIKSGHYDEAAQAMLQSKWATQVGNRARRLSQQLATGVWV